MQWLLEKFKKTKKKKERKNKNQTHEKKKNEQNYHIFLLTSVKECKSLS